MLQNQLSNRRIGRLEFFSPAGGIITSHDLGRVKTEPRPGIATQGLLRLISGGRAAVAWEQTALAIMGAATAGAIVLAFWNALG